MSSVASVVGAAKSKNFEESTIEKNSK